MNGENRKKVLSYINKHGKDVGIRFGIQLYLDGYSTDPRTKGERIKILKNLKANGPTMSIENIIKKILELSDWFGTRYIKINRKQCHAGARRTCIDIWRLVRYYKNEPVEIFTVMHILYNLMHDRNSHLISSWCSVVRRRTFRIESNRITRDYMEDTQDEFHLKLPDWKDI